MSIKKRPILSVWTWFFLGVLILFLWACQVAKTPLDLEALQQEIYIQTNALRAERGLAPLIEQKQLAYLSERHSQDMRERQFFEHKNPDGLTPFQRMERLTPELLSIQSGENIAMQGLAGLDTAGMAKQLMKLWRESPEHYKHIVSPDFWHLGVGLAQAEDRIYATQTFAAVLVKLREPLEPEYREGQRLYLDFEFLAPFPAKELSAFWHTPNEKAHIHLGDGRAYIGKGPLKLEWKGNKRFSLNVPLLYGTGTYRVLLGRNRQYFNAPYEIKVRK